MPTTTRPQWISSSQLDVLELLSARRRRGLGAVEVATINDTLNRAARRDVRDLAAKGLVRQRPDGCVAATTAGLAVR